LDKAEAEFRRAIELNPSFPTAHQWYSQLLAWEKRLSEAQAELAKAVEASPLSLIINTNLVDGMYYRREFDQGIAQAKKVMDMDPNFSTVYPSLIQVYLGKSMGEEAMRAAETYSKMTGSLEAKLVFAYVHAHVGRKEESKKLLEEAEAKYGRESVSPYVIALTYFKLGENDRGFQWLDKAYDGYDRNVYAMTIDYELDGVRSDPRYLAMLKRLGLAQHIRG
ncbi:MAG: hypothetical protein HY297_02105, partial [Thaumarchaeota archaeon]|nr:hypothetical protein [Nitrososphaerota archaeon]